ncbi:hypothetical protein BDV28DRAFT_1480 [Aspergillus coremiiformis]|uniref:Cullin binding protein CanA n=1 Tax=Aspergillus coremiiformis TaxID=138285 RepID=A0A5N6ZLG6_9EURO|nr:hypothetical protein BDV28DRAFT_1480 [Aspergillus coremiiformis]
MPFSDHAPRLGFLKDAASSLSLLSPSTAAHLMTVHNRIFLDESRPLNQRQQEASCGACGSIRNPEWTKTIHIKKGVTKRTGSSAATDSATVYKCLRCRRRTVRPTRKEPLRSNPSSTVATATDSTPSTALPVEHSDSTEKKLTRKTADNANSKKRAKTRKQGGLQALLASRQRSQASSSLDLFDFLQQ